MTVMLSLFKAEKFLGVTAKTLSDYRNEGNEAAYEKVFADALFKTVVARARVKQEQVQEEQRVKCSFMKVDEVDFVSESRQLLDAIAKYN